LPQTALTHVRRASGRVDHYDGFSDHDGDAIFEDDFEDCTTSPVMQRFIESMGKAVETSSIGLSFEYRDLSYETKDGKRILSSVSGIMPRGSCWGIMGGSGAGKSTFVNVLMGKIRAKEGFIKINGHSKDMTKYKKLIGYVPQDDIVLPELTVRENILHSARVRLLAKWNEREIKAHVDALIACLQLTHVQHSRVGDATRPVISGGQRKRVNIGMELASAPMAIFLDEPTSGLDATSAASIMRLLRAISRLGVTTIAIVHQPREQIFYGFDQLLLLAQGHAVYSGPTQDCQAYFEELGFSFPERGNPADVLIDIATGDGSQYAACGKRDLTTVPALIEHWKSHGQSAIVDTHISLDGTSTPIKRSRRASAQSVASSEEQEESLRLTMGARGATWPVQVYHCLNRALTQQVRNSTSFFYEIGVGALAGGIIGLSAYASGGHLFQGIYHPPFTILSSAVDYQSTPQLGLLGAMAIGLAASAPGFWVFGEEKMMFWRETAAGHSRSAYYLGKMLATLPRITLTSLHFTVFMGILATPLISFTDMWMANLMYFWCIYGLASVVSMLVKREDGPLVAVLASLVVGMLSGVAPPLKQAKAWHME
jgi:ABC-type multidrug transport system ATPase subunit